MSGLITTTDLSLAQTWVPDAATFKVGDALKRRLVSAADGVAGMAFTPIRHAELDGVGIYPAQPEVSDRIERGELISGKRTETVTYVFLKPGSVTLPAIRLYWWDPSAREIRLAEAQERVVEVAPNPAAGKTNAEAGTPALSVRKMAVYTILLLVVFAALIILAQRQGFWRAPLGKDEIAGLPNERVLFRCVVRTSHTGDPRDTLTALMAWLDVLEEKVARTDLFVQRYGNAQLGQEVLRLLGAALGDEHGASWTPRRLAKCLKQARTAYLGEKRRAEQARDLLPPLNPARRDG